MPAPSVAQRLAFRIAKLLGTASMMMLVAAGRFPQATLPTRPTPPAAPRSSGGYL
jgi:hypothetical protein